MLQNRMYNLGRNINFPTDEVWQKYQNTSIPGPKIKQKSANNPMLVKNMKTILTKSDVEQVLHAGSGFGHKDRAPHAHPRDTTLNDDTARQDDQVAEGVVSEVTGAWNVLVIPDHRNHNAQDGDPASRDDANIISDERIKMRLQGHFCLSTP